jgi:hypothetical protein
MDPFRLCVAMLPLAVYLLMLAAINFARRPVVVTGARDMAGLGLAVIGLLIVGPIELLLPVLPSEASGYYWLLLLLIYGLILTLGVLLSAPRLVVYNVSLDQLRTVLSEVVTELDSEARWAGSSVALPRLHVVRDFARRSKARRTPAGWSSCSRRWRWPSGWVGFSTTIRAKSLRASPRCCGSSRLRSGRAFRGLLSCTLGRLFRLTEATEANPIGAITVVQAIGVQRANLGQQRGGRLEAVEDRIIVG